MGAVNCSSIEAPRARNLDDEWNHMGITAVCYGQMFRCHGWWILRRDATVRFVRRACTPRTLGIRELSTSKAPFSGVADLSRVRREWESAEVQFLAEVMVTAALSVDRGWMRRSATSRRLGNL